MSIASDIANSLRPIATRVGNMVKRAILERIDDSEGTQLVQASLLEDEVQDRVEHMQPYGLSFVPPAGSEGLAFAVQGAGSNRVVLCASKRGDRPTGAKAGEGGLYSLGEWRVFIDEEGVLHLGKKDPDDAAALASEVIAAMTTLKNAIAGAAVGSADGGAALKANIVAALADWPPSSIASETVLIQS